MNDQSQGIARQCDFRPNEVGASPLPRPTTRYCRYPLGGWVGEWAGAA